jgi:hypothetical protein
MTIASYQVNNVLRVYGEKLRQGKALGKIAKRPHPGTDEADFSMGAKRKSLIDRIASKIVDKILQDGPHDDLEKEVFRKLQEECGASLAVTIGDAKGLLYRMIDEKGESLHSLSIEDAGFLTSKLKEITTETIDKKMP